MKVILTRLTDRQSGNQANWARISPLALILIFLTTACEKEKPIQAPPPPVVEVTEVQQRDVPVYQEWVGSLDGMVNAQILAQISGYLIKQHYQEGQLVKKGQLLYEIDPRVFQATLDGARSNLARQEAQLKTARLDMDRVKRLLPEKAVSVRDRDNAVGREASILAEVMAARAAVDSAQLQLGFTKITSPIDGIAGLSKTQLGNLVGPGSSNAVLTTVSQVDPIKAFIPLSEQQYLEFVRDRQNGGESKKSRPLELILADGTTYAHPGKFFFADRQVDVRTGTIQAAILFPNPGSFLRPGQYARVRAIVKNREGALLIPQRALIDMQGRKLVAVVNSDNTVAIRPVVTAENVGTLIVVEKGLQPGERVIVEGIQKARAGAKVDPKPYADVSADAGS
ncbi:efflux RND transporter periplasmic adaptor subunit [Methylicorpusculum sp.]|uniref:efflux RND transporter periplasmic adaptor subunit n=1 Tax=Methylicorpusculum sp. TaxID=2713644 RepID=UPI002723FE49|nr:efflux RND transporter periplasmic adaptor subunit [Methylicorpusculum sp.]MDO8846037.1 efflux RND transporter periplasmic adaptor subunit [Methylicorpusculum sp.]MDP2179921.1 efflux RND transporter periplasmic adaptor subunit [Methylicorpusculum sp.]MDP3528362.1 efflux RND transporter periplasmic adaptor subunit [Methylicorpusculum sp.]MDZ4154160.1 efflux RND transporter periplasmic adaptor subunit [Methylicorpusculum sp.]